MSKLNQILAVEKSLKTRVQQELDVMYKALQKPALFDGFNKTYKPSLEDEATQPPQTQRVQLTVDTLMEKFRGSLNELLNIAAQKDFANLTATSDIVIDGVTVAQSVPSTHLLFLEKQLTDLYTVVSKLPILDPAEEWHFDEVKHLYATSPTQTQRTRKVAKPIVLYPATTEHPAQTQLLTEDVPVGIYEQVKLSGATTEERRKKLLDRIVVMQRAVKFAREKANLAEAPTQAVGTSILSWIFS